MEVTLFFVNLGMLIAIGVVFFLLWRRSSNWGFLVLGLALCVWPPPLKAIKASVSDKVSPSHSASVDLIHHLLLRAPVLVGALMLLRSPRTTRQSKLTGISGGSQKGQSNSHR